MRLHPRWTVLLALLTGGCCLLTSRGVAHAAEKAEAPHTITLHILDDATSHPIAGALVEVSTTTDTTVQAKQYHTDTAGVAHIDLPTTCITWLDGGWKTYYLRIEAEMPDHVRLEKLYFRPAHYDTPQDPVPIDLEQGLRLPKPVPIGGRVEDENGKPIKGVKISADLLWKDTSQSRKENSWMASNDGGRVSPASAECQTGANGRWTYLNMPEAGSDQVIWLTADHDDYQGDFSFRGNGVEDYSSLRNGTLKIAMRKTYGVEILLRDPAGKPVPDAEVQWEHKGGHIGGYYHESMDREQGIYRLSQLPRGDCYALIKAKGYAPALEPIKPGDPYPKVTVTLKPGRRIQGRVEDQFGKPFANIFLRAKKWRDVEEELVELKTDAQGRFEWNEAPEDAVCFEYYDQEYKQIEMQERAEPYVIRVMRNLNVRGKVVDAESGREIRNYKVIGGAETGPGRIEWDERSSFEGRMADTPDFKGRFSVWLRKPALKQYLRLEAPGYETTVSRAFENEAGEATLDFKIKPATSGAAGSPNKSSGLRGVLLQPDGTPLANMMLSARFGKADPSMDMIASQQKDTGTGAQTDVEGKFNIETPAAPYVVEITGVDMKKMRAVGVVELTDRDLDPGKENTIRLKPIRINKGTARIGIKPAARTRIDLEPYHYKTKGPTHDWSSTFQRNQTDENGHFGFSVARAMEVKITLTPMNSAYAETPPSRRIWFSQFLHLDPETSMSLDIGGEGGLVKGQVTRLAPSKSELKWDQVGCALRSWPAKSNIPASYDSRASEDQWSEAWAKVDSKEWYRRRVRYSFDLDENGGFQIDDVPAGNYEVILNFSQEVTHPDGGISFKTVGYARCTFQMPAVKSGGDGKLFEVPAMEIKPYNDPQN